MIIENIELTMSQVSLGQLDEYGAMVLFGNAHSHHLVNQLEHTPEDIRDQNGLLLYPAYFMTHLKVPPHRLLNRYRAWERLSVGCHVERFGETMLDSRYILGHEAEISEDLETWTEDYVSMWGNNLLVVDPSQESNARKVSVPRPGAMATLQKKSRPPLALTRSRKVRGHGFESTGPGRMRGQNPTIYQLAPFRDAVPGHAMIFAMFSRLMDYSEYHLLSQQLSPALPTTVLNHLNLLERETFYFGNCFAGDEVAIQVTGDMELLKPDFHGEALDIVSAARFTFNFEVTNNRNGALLSLSRTVKLLALPTALQDLTQDIKRFHHQHYTLG